MCRGTVNCNVCIPDEPIGLPRVAKPDVSIAVNLSSPDKFVNEVVPGGMIIIDSSLINKKVERTDVNVICVSTSKLANDMESKEQQI